MSEHRNEKIIVRYDPEVCQHAAHCVKTLPGVFDPNRNPWIDVNGADADAIQKTIAGCPSGALSFQLVR